MKKKVAICFDLDGTVTKQEILPLISKELGIFEEINLLTQITLKGLIPFQNSFKLRVKLLDSIAISVVKKIVSSTLIDPHIQQFIETHADQCYIVTGNLDVWVEELIEQQLGCQFFSSLAEKSGDKLLGLKSILDKRDAILQLRNQYEHIITVGDSMNDCSMFEVADTKIAFGGVHEPVESLIKLSNYVIYDSKSLVQVLKNNLVLYEN